MAASHHDVKAADLGLVLRARVAAWLACLSLGIFYVATMSRDLSLYDSGELALAAVQLGLGHPPGQPLHTLLGHLAALLSLSAPLIGINLVSALPAALTLIPATSIAETLAGAKRARHWLPWSIALIAVHESLWEPATRIEVYALATFFAVWAVARALPPLLEGAAVGPLLAAAALRAGVALGLSASVNPMIALCTGLAIAPALLHGALRHGLLLRVLGRAALGGALGLLPYLYLPLAAARGDVMVWGGLHDAASYLRYLSMRDYARNQTLGLAGWLDHAGQWLSWSTERLWMPLLILGAGAFARAPFRVRTAHALLPIALLLLLAVIAFNVVFYLDVPDYDGYMATVYWLAAAGCGAFMLTCLRSSRPIAAAAIGCCMLVGWLAPPAPFARTRQRDTLARALAEQVLREAPENAIMIAFADYYAGTFFYLQEAEHARPDVVVLAYGLSGSSWHWRRLYKRHPELAEFDPRASRDRAQRVRAWLAANPQRPVLVERLEDARSFGLAACPGGLYLRTGAPCTAPSSAAAALLGEQLRRLGQGSPGAAGAIAQVSERLGEAWWRLNWPRQAHDVLLAGAPRSAWPQPLAAAATLERAGPLRESELHWQRGVALGEPGRNVFLAGMIAAASGQATAARAYLLAASRAGLPEATDMLLHPH